MLPAALWDHVAPARRDYHRLPHPRWAAECPASARRGSCRQAGDDDVVDMGMGQAMRTAVVLEGGDHPALRLDRREFGETGVLQQFERGVVRGPGSRPDGLDVVP